MKMLHLIILIFLPGFIYSQEKNSSEKEKFKVLKYELGLNFCSFLNLWTSPVYNITENSYINGLSLKRRYSQSAIRISFDRMHINLGVPGEKEKGSRTFYYKENGTKIINELRLGAEKELLKRRFRPFIAADLLFGYGRSEGIIEGNGDFPPYYFTYEFKNKRSYIGIAPAVGLKYQVCDRLSVTLETNLSVIAFHETDLLTSETSNLIEVYFNPLRLLSLNYLLRRCEPVSL
jgi:hypothetical protein